METQKANRIHSRLDSDLGLATRTATTTAKLIRSDFLTDFLKPIHWATEMPTQTAIH